jgi:hypothetical protein
MESLSRFSEKSGYYIALAFASVRHQMPTFLTAKGLSDAQIHLISRHETKKSLEVYQRPSLE